MTGFTFTAEQVRAAPPEVRRWIENQVLAALGTAGEAEHEPTQIHAATLASCTFEDALQMFDLIKDDFLLTQVFFELARSATGPYATVPLLALDVDAILRHTRLADAGQLSKYLMSINQAFQRVRHDPQAGLFGVDRRGRLFIHEETHASVQRVWEQFIAANAPAPAANTGATTGLDLPTLGPSEAV